MVIKFKTFSPYWTVQFLGSTSPFDVRLPDQRKSALLNKDIHTVVQPDLCIICDPAKLDDRAA